MVEVYQRFVKSHLEILITVADKKILRLFWIKMITKMENMLSDTAIYERIVEDPIRKAIYEVYLSDGKAKVMSPIENY